MIEPKDHFNNESNLRGVPKPIVTDRKYWHVLNGAISSVVLFPVLIHTTS